MISGTVSSQQKLIQKSWIKTSVEELRETDPEPDTAYLRYEFDNTEVKISFHPGWNDYQQTWATKGNKLKIGFATWKIEQLTDSSLTLVSYGFRRMNFLAENYLNQKEEYLHQIGEFNGKPVYQGNHYISPRYKKNNLDEDLRKQSLDDYNIHNARTFLMSFIVTEKGEIEDVKILKGIVEGYDKMLVEQLIKTSRDWRPAMYKNKPIQTQLFYKIVFLDSIVEH
jgi:hypothetical protein